MDKYGCYRNNENDWAELRISLRHHGSIVFPYSNGNGGCMIIHIDTRYGQLGTMPFGGNPHGRYYVGVYMRGCGHLSAEQKEYPDYVGEKLNIPKEDAETFAELWNNLFNL